VAQELGVEFLIEGGRVMSMRSLFLFGILCPLLATSALPTGGAAPVPEKRDANFPQFVRVWGCELIKREKEIVLKGPDSDRSLILLDRSHILTAKEYKPPFALFVKAKTDSKNLRLYYNVGMLIFNWEGNENELRIHDPATGEEISVADQGKIEPDTYHDIVWEMYPNGTRVLVDGKERTRRLGDYEKLEASLGIGPAFGSVITMKSFRVEVLKGKLPE
jgi:hypothetical protein